MTMCCYLPRGSSAISLGWIKADPEEGLAVIHRPTGGWSLWVTRATIHLFSLQSPRKKVLTDPPLPGVAERLVPSTPLCPSCHSRVRDGELESSWRDLFPKDILSELESDLVHMTTAVKGQGFSEYGPWGTTMPVTLELVEKNATSWIIPSSTL